MIWNYLEDNVQKGPVTDADLEALVRTGKMDANTLVWRAGMETWKPYREAMPAMAGATDSLPLPTPLASEGNVVCAECGGSFPPDQVIRHGNAFICGGCKPVFLQKLKEGVGITGVLNYAGFGIRFGAKMIDGILLMAVTVPVNLLLAVKVTPGPPSMSRMLITTPIGMVVGATYYTLFVGKFAATPGKMACKLRIVNPDGSKVGYGKAFGRYFAAEYVSGLLTLFIGYLMVIWDDEKRALHDRICSTRVIRK